MKKALNHLAIVVLFWNDSEKTIKCLKSLFKQKRQKFNIVLVALSANVFPYLDSRYEYSFLPPTQTTTKPAITFFFND